MVSGCASLAPGSAGTAAPSAAAPDATARSFHDAIDIGGRLSLRYEQNGPQALDGKFSWVQADGLTRITLATPFGQTLATIEVTPQLSTLTRAGQPPRSEANVDLLIAGTLGWPLPVAGLRDWLQGFAVDEQGARRSMRADATGDAEYVKTADGWLIHYPVWDTPAPDAPHPKRIDLQRMTSQAGDVSLRIVIDQWQPR